MIALTMEMMIDGSGICYKPEVVVNIHGNRFQIKPVWRIPQPQFEVYGGSVRNTDRDGLIEQLVVNGADLEAAKSIVSHIEKFSENFRRQNFKNGVIVG